MVSQCQPQRNGLKQVKPTEQLVEPSKKHCQDASTFQGSEIATEEQIAPTEDDLTTQNEKS